MPWIDLGLPPKLTLPEWSSMRGSHRARFWRRHDWLSMRAAKATLNFFIRRHWLEQQLPAFMADLNYLRSNPDPE